MDDDGQDETGLTIADLAGAIAELAGQVAMLRQVVLGNVPDDASGLA